MTSKDGGEPICPGCEAGSQLNMTAAVAACPCMRMTMGLQPPNKLLDWKPGSCVHALFANLIVRSNVEFSMGTWRQALARAQPVSRLVIAAVVRMPNRHLL